MKRRRVLVAGGTAGVASLAGCTTRATGWSSLRLLLDNQLETAVRLQVVIQVNGMNQMTRTVRLKPNATKRIGASVEVPWDATLTFQAARRQTDAQAAERWAAQVPLWGGNKCMIEPVFTVNTGGIQIASACGG